MKGFKPEAAEFVSLLHIAVMLHSEFDKLFWLATLPHREARVSKQSTASHLKYLLSSQYVLDIMVEKNQWKTK